MTTKTYLGALVAGLCLAAALYFPVRAAVTGDSLPEKWILMVGNSYTFANDMPGMLEKMLNADGSRSHTYRISLIAAGGAKLADHVRSQSVAAQLQERSYAFVFLQEQSTTSFYTNEAPRSDAAFGTLIDLARQHGAQPVVFSSWARKAGNIFYTDPRRYSNLLRPRDPKDMTIRLDAVYRQIAGKYGAAYIPLGAYWWSLLQARPQTELYIADGSHPSINGSYLMALLAYRHIAKDIPADIWHPAQMEPAYKDMLVNLLARQ